MLFGLQTGAQLEAAKIAGAQARLQRRMEDSPDVPTMQPGGVTVMPPPAFVNGPGGSRMSPEDLEYRRRRNDQQMAAGMDTSPVGHWTQGFARVAQALVASQDRQNLNKAAASNMDARSAIIAELSKPNPNQNAVATAVSDPDPGVREFGGRVWSMQHPKPQGPSDLQQRVEYLDGFKPGLGGQYASNYAANGGGAPQFVTIPGGGTFMVPRGPVTAGASTSSAPVPDNAVSYLQSNPGTADQFDAKYGPGASAQYLQGGAASQAPTPFVTR